MISDTSTTPAGRSKFPGYVIVMSLLVIFFIVILLFISRRKGKNKFSKDSFDDGNPAVKVSTESPVQQLSLFPHMYNLDIAREYIYQGKLSEAYREIEQVIVSVISERFEIRRGETFENIYAGLVRRYVPDELAKQTVSLLQDCQVAQFSPLIEGNQAMADYEMAKIILDKLQSSTT
jgi:hypothetical protein